MSIPCGIPGIGGMPEPVGTPLTAGVIILGILPTHRTKRINRLQIQENDFQTFLKKKKTSRMLQLYLGKPG